MQLADQRDPRGRPLRGPLGEETIDLHLGVAACSQPHCDPATVGDVVAA
jgi:hypothetical protein